MSDVSSELFEQLYCDNQTKVYRLALGLTGNADDAEEITQEAFFRAFRSFAVFRQESSFFTWIYKITLNVARSYLKKKAKLPIHMLTENEGYVVDEIIDQNPESNPEMAVLANEIRVRCLHCFTECLPVNQRIVFCLAVTIGLQHKITAEILDCSIGSVKTTLNRARKRIAGYMENKCQLIKKSNPCNCQQWIRFALSQGWISKQKLERPHSLINIQVKEEIVRLQTLRDIYRQVYQEKAGESFMLRIKQGIKNGEWAVFRENL